MKKKKLIIVFFLFLIFLFYRSHFADYLNFQYIKSHLDVLMQYVENEPIEAAIIYFVVYVVFTAISIPGAVVLTVLGGALFGLLYGVIIVSISSTAGATVAFLISRYLFKDWVSKRFFKEIKKINENIKREGALYLFTLRLIHFIPFFVINLAMGITSISTVTYTIVSMIGMLPATIIYVYAGLRFSQLSSAGEILSSSILTLLMIIAIFPLVTKFLIFRFKLHRLYKRFSKPKVISYDIVVVGAGAAGLMASYLASTLKARVALVEKHKMGGDCLNTGCVPSKSLIKTANVINFKNKVSGLGLDNVEVSFKFEKVFNSIKERIQKISPKDSKERYEKLGVHCFIGHAQIISPYEVRVNDTVLTTLNLVIATGASPIVPDIPGIKNADYVTSDNLWDLKELPEKLLIIGGGGIGCEMAQSFARLGSQVTILENGSRILSKEDPEVSEFVESTFNLEKIIILKKATLLEFGRIDEQKFVLYKDNEGIKKIIYDKVLLAIGRKPNLDELGIAELELELNDNGTIFTNKYMQTNYPNIYACGDAAGPYQLTHVASHQAWYCVFNALFGVFKKLAINYNVVPWCTFTEPEIATVGQNETTLAESQVEFEVTKFYLDDLDRAITDNETAGFVKVITQKNTDRILGVTIVSVNASTMILEFVSAMKFKKGLKAILKTIHLYPSFGESNRLVAGLWSKNHTPPWVFDLLEKYFNYRRRN